MTPRIVPALPLAVLTLILFTPPAARARLDLSMAPTPPRTGSGPTLSLGSVGPELCPAGLCRTPPHGNLFYFMTKGTHPIEPVPGILLRIPLGGGGR